MRSTTAQVRKHPGSAVICPAWCEIQHQDPLEQSLELQENERVHTLRIGSLPYASVSVCQVDSLTTGEPGEPYVWAETEGLLNTEQSIRYAELVTKAVAMVRGPAA